MPKGLNGHERSQERFLRKQATAAQAAGKTVVTGGNKYNFDLSNPAHAVLFATMFLGAVLPATAAGRANTRTKNNKGNQKDNCIAPIEIKKQPDGQYAAVPPTGWGIKGTPETCQTLVIDLSQNNPNSPSQNILTQLQTGSEKCQLNIVVDKKTGIPTLALPKWLTNEQLAYLQNPKKYPDKHKKVLELLESKGIDLGKLCEFRWDVDYSKRGSTVTVTFPEAENNENPHHAVSFDNAVKSYLKSEKQGVKIDRVCDNMFLVSKDPSGKIHLHPSDEPGACEVSMRTLARNADVTVVYVQLNEKGKPENKCALVVEVNNETGKMKVAESNSPLQACTFGNKVRSAPLGGPTIGLTGASNKGKASADGTATNPNFATRVAATTRAANLTNAATM